MRKTTKFIFCVAACCFLSHFCAAVETDADGGNAATVGVNALINPGFEEEKPAGWSLRNWWSRKNESGESETNDYTATRDTDNPHSGKYCYRITARKMLGGDLQFMNVGSKIPVLKPGMAVELSFWLRGQSNAGHLTVLFRQDAAPWSHYFLAKVAPEDEWTEHRFRITLPDKTDPNDTVLMFQVHSEQTIWLDDISLSQMPEVEQGKSSGANAVHNGTFETGRDRWYTTFRENNPLKGLYAEENNTAAEVTSVVIEDAPQGKRAMHVPVKEYCSATVSSAKFPLLYGHDTKIKFALKASQRKARITAILCAGVFPNTIEEGKSFSASGNEWQEFEFQVKPKPSTDGKYNLIFKMTDTADFYFDSICVTQDGIEGVAVTEPLSVGWEPVGEDHPANIFSREENVSFNILVAAKAGQKSAKLHGRLLDPWNREVQPLALEVALDQDGYGKQAIRFPSDTYGAFKAELFSDDNLSAMPDCELIYTVPHELTPMKDVRDSFFGGHVRLTPFNLYLAEKAGFRWLRLHPPMNSKWEYIEQTPGAFTFHIAGLERASQMGFKILGSLQTVPRFYADVPEGENHNWYHCYPPKDEAAWKAYERYVGITARALKPYINAWEIWNEADGKFLQVPEGQVREDIYLKLTELSRKALDENGIDVPLIAGGITGAQRPFMGGILTRNVGKYIDALSFHHYGGLPGKIRLDNITDWHRYTNRSGDLMPIWHTEGEPFTRRAIWLKTTGLDNAFDTTKTMAQQGGMLLKSLAYFKAHGVRKHFFYEAYGSASGMYINRLNFGNMLSVNGLATPVVAAHAAAVFFLEGATPIGMDEFAQGDVSVSVARFIRDRKNIMVVWADKPIAATQVSRFQDEKYACYDVMGNEIMNPEMIVFGDIPVCCLEK